MVVQDGVIVISSDDEDEAPNLQTAGSTGGSSPADKRAADSGPLLAHGASAGSSSVPAHGRSAGGSSSPAAGGTALDVGCYCGNDAGGSAGAGAGASSPPPADSAATGAMQHVVIDLSGDDNTSAGCGGASAAVLSKGSGTHADISGIGAPSLRPCCSPPPPAGLAMLVAAAPQQPGCLHPMPLPPPRSTPPHAAQARLPPARALRPEPPACDELPPRLPQSAAAAALPQPGGGAAGTPAAAPQEARDRSDAAAAPGPAPLRAKLWARKSAGGHPSARKSTAAAAPTAHGGCGGHDGRHEVEGTATPPWEEPPQVCARYNTACSSVLAWRA